MTKNKKNKREIQQKIQDQEEEEQDSLAIATQVIPIANTPRSNKKERYKGSYYKSIREVDLEKERERERSSLTQVQ